MAEDSAYDLEYLVALLNSDLFQWRFRVTSTNNNVGTNELETMPFRRINFEDAAETETYRQIVDNVKQVIKAYERLNTATSTSDKRRYREISVQLAARIDDHVSSLYRLERFQRKPWKEWVPPSKRDHGRARQRRVDPPDIAAQ